MVRDTNQFSGMKMTLDDTNVATKRKNKRILTRICGVQSSIIVAY